MHRFLATQTDLKSDLVLLSPEESKHAAQVLRLTAGDVVELLDGYGQRAGGVVETVAKREVSIRVKTRASTPGPAIKLILCPALLKGKAMDWLVQKACELGASAIQPIATDRCVAKVEPAEAASKVESWRSTALEALKQCGNVWLPEIHAPMPLAKACRQFATPETLQLVASLQESSRTIREHLETWRERNKTAPQQITLWIGPEGDFTPTELAELQNSGALPFTLGHNVLRAETAALAALAVLSQETLAFP